MLDRIRQSLEERPVRSLLEDTTSRVPSGPLGAFGEGNVIGFIGFLAVESGEIITVPIPGVQRPGFKKVSHGVETIQPGVQEHTIRMHAVSEDVGEFVSQYESAPSNYDFVFGNTEVVDITKLDTDVGYTTYEFVVRVDRRPLME